MTRTLRAGMASLVLAVVLGAVLGQALVDPAPAAARSSAAAPRSVAAVDARLDGAYAMAGRITAAVRVGGEHRGQQVSRRWILAGQSCTANECASLVLRRQRSAGRYDTLVLVRVGVGRYAGSGSFSAGLRCRGRTYPQGELVPYRIALTITQATVIQGTAFAGTITATYTNTHRIDRTICPIGPSHDAAVYTGAASPLPSPPTAAFSENQSPGSTTVAFADRTVPGASGAPVVGWRWDFGDPGAGAADIATTEDPLHAFTGPGSYLVCLTAIDAAGLQGRSCAAVAVAGA